MTERILVINPNSSKEVTTQIDLGLEFLRRHGGMPIECLTSTDGPRAVELQADVEQAVRPLCSLIAREDASAYVVACYSDPGLTLARERTSRPVLGIGEASMMLAMTRGERFGIIAILQSSVRRQQRMVRALGFESRYAGSRPLGLGVHELGDHAAVSHRMTEVAKTLRGAHQADILILGCAGMVGFRQPLEEALGIPVIEPTQAAVAMALGLSRLDWWGEGAVGGARTSGVAAGG